MKRFRSLTTSATKNCLFPRRKILNGVAPHPSPLPRGRRVKLENRLRGRGDNRKAIDGIISDRVKYNDCASRFLHYFRKEQLGQLFYEFQRLDAR